MVSYLSILRPFNGVMSAIAVYIGTILVGGMAVPAKETLLGMLVVFLISGGGMVVNDIFDIAADKINKPNRPIPSGKMSVKAAYIYSVILFLVGNAISYIYLNTNAFYITVLATLVLIAYNSRLKRVMLLGHLLVSFLVALTFIYGGVLQSNTYQAILPFAALAFLANVGREIYKTIEDALGDKKMHVTTLAIKFGVFKTRILAALFVIAAVGLSIVPYIMGLADVVYLGIVILADIVFVAAIASPMRHSSKLVKIGMNVALLAFLLGAWSFNGVF